MFTFVGGDDNEFEVQLVRYKPEAIDSLIEKSKFSRKELQIMYRGFKQVGRKHVKMRIIN